MRAVKTLCSAFIVCFLLLLSYITYLLKLSITTSAFVYLHSLFVIFFFVNIQNGFLRVSLHIVNALERQRQCPPTKAHKRLHGHIRMRICICFSA